MPIRLLFLFLLTLAATTAPADVRKDSIPHDAAMEAAVKASSLDLIAVQHEGWAETLPTYARLKVHELTGRQKVPGQDPSYTILSLIYETPRWLTARVLPVEHPDLLPALDLDGKWVSWRQVTESPKLKSMVERLQAGAARETELKQIRTLVNTVEQAKRLGASERVLAQYELEGVSPAQVGELLDNPEKLVETHRRRKELEAEVKANAPFQRAGERLLNRCNVLTSIGETFLIAPYPDAIDGAWARPAVLAGAGSTTWKAAGEFDTQLGAALLGNKPEQIAPAASAFLEVASRSRAYPSEPFRKAQNFYVNTNPWRIAAWTYLLSAITFGLFAFFQHRGFYWGGIGIMGLGFIAHTAAMGLRLYLKGHVPVSNMFEAITFCSWAVVLIAMVVEAFSRRALVGIGAMVTAFLLLTGAGLMPLHDTRIHPLRAVLNSYWLNIHVTMMLFSYAAFAIAAFFACVYLVRALTARQLAVSAAWSGGVGAVLFGLYFLAVRSEAYFLGASTWINIGLRAAELVLMLGGGLGLLTAAAAGLGWVIKMLFSIGGGGSGDGLMSLVQTEEFAYRLVQLGWPLLTLGVTLGGVWADTAWGRFWGWDPKETWAFITWVVYTVYLHSRMVMGWRGKWSAVACLLGFVVVLITFLGVSYLPWFSGGLHSYASPT